MGSTYRSLGENARAAVACRRAIELNPQQGNYFLNPGGALMV
ncbi:MAG: hypothetical protein GY815_06030 [Gammaproteobacteria bacterium]|nr:hypothetical protein [Gammaproteobacteria bacterium]